MKTKTKKKKRYLLYCCYFYTSFYHTALMMRSFLEGRKEGSLSRTLKSNRREKSTWKCNYTQVERARGRALSLFFFFHACVLSCWGFFSVLFGLVYAFSSFFLGGTGEDEGEGLGGGGCVWPPSPSPAHLALVERGRRLFCAFFCSAVIRMPAVGCRRLMVCWSRSWLW